MEKNNSIYTNLIIDYLTENLTVKKSKEFEKELQTNFILKTEFDKIKSLNDFISDDLKFEKIKEKQKINKYFYKNLTKKQKILFVSLLVFFITGLISSFNNFLDWNINIFQSKLFIFLSLVIIIYIFFKSIKYKYKKN